MFIKNDSLKVMKRTRFWLESHSQSVKFFIFINSSAIQGLLQHNNVYFLAILIDGKNIQVTVQKSLLK